ncbi:hypothetical protein GC175_33060 [bacterium]|nr:hypothetical protein [bacterium]
MRPLRFHSGYWIAFWKITTRYWAVFGLLFVVYRWVLALIVDPELLRIGAFGGLFAGAPLIAFLTLLTFDKSMPKDKTEI